MTVRIGAKLPNSGPLPERVGIPAMAARLERAGFASLWCSDHIVMPHRIDSWYPFAPDGRATWDTTSPWYDAVVSMSLAAGATSRAQIGVAVLVLPLRHPVTFAKQIASLDALSGGRIALGVGAGWLAEEFAALEVPYDSRGSRLDEWIDLLRACWTGAPATFKGRHYRLPAGVQCFPTPAAPVPVLVGGLSAAALRRAARRGQGWLALQRAEALDPGELAPAIASMRQEASAVGRDSADLRVVLRVVESVGRAEQIAAALPALAAVGVDEIVPDVDWSGDGDVERVHDLLRDAAS